MGIGDCIKLVLGIGTGIPGMGHLWYISTILVCYFITPLVIGLITPSKNYFGILAVCVASEILFAVVPGFTGAWINCYIIGLILGNAYARSEIKAAVFRKTVIFSTTCMVLLCGMEIILKYVLHFSLNGILGKVANTVFHYGHIAIALTVFSFFMLLFHTWAKKTHRFYAFLDRFDQYSYDAYIVHLFFILGPSSFFKGRQTFVQIGIGVIFLLGSIAISAYILRLLSSIIEKQICGWCHSNGE